jgi:secreted trypsin-like serine protease
MIDLLQFVIFSFWNHHRSLFAHATMVECQSIDPCGCSRNHVDIRARLLGGETAASHTWGWATSIRNSNGMHICGGTILSKDFIITAAHCFRTIPTEQSSYSIVVGIDWLLSQTGQQRAVSHVFLHPAWNFTSKHNDIAILKLDRSITMEDINVNRICLPEIMKSEQISYPIVSSLLVAIGWGNTIWDDYFSLMYLRQATLNVIHDRHTKCNKILTDIYSQFCASMERGEKGITYMFHCY